MKNEITTTNAAARRTSTNDEIACRAYEIWEKAGRPEGREQDHWLQAENELAQKRQSVEKPAGSPPKKSETTPQRGGLSAPTRAGVRNGTRV